MAIAPTRNEARPMARDFRRRGGLTGAWHALGARNLHVDASAESEQHAQREVVLEPCAMMMIVPRITDVRRQS